MASILIRDIDDLTKQTLRIRAARNGVSMEEEARHILREALLRSDAPARLGRHLVNRFAGLSSEEFELPNRRTPRAAPEWHEPA